MTKIKAQIIELHKVGNFPCETLAYLTANGVEFPDASALIADALKLTAAQIAEMHENY
jgi:hypothetical protein